MFKFDLKANGTNVRTEVLAGVTTFLSMVYILAVYPNVMGSIGIPARARAAITYTALVKGMMVCSPRRLSISVLRV